jgi:NitT/TauT family transport system substrate-binding protein
MITIMESHFLKKNGFRIFLAGIFSLLIFGCDQNVQSHGLANAKDSSANGPSQNKVLREVSFLPYWVTNAQFAGYYVAKEKGIYEKYGINLRIIPYKPFVTSSDSISSGDADFATLWLVNAISLRAKGTNIVNIAQMSTRSSAMLITKKSSGIDSVQKMDGKRAGIWSGFELQPRALFNKYNINVKIIPIGSTNNLFLMGGVDIVNANWFDEYHSIINSGYDPEDLNVFFFADYGLNFLEDGIYCLSEKLKNDPELCRDFVNATLEGWRYAFNHTDEAIEIVLKYAKADKQPVNRVHQKWMLDRYRDLYLPKGKSDFNTILSEKDYQFAGNALKENKLIDEVPEYGKFYKPIIMNK